MQQRHYREDVSLSIIGFGGMVLVGMEQHEADRIVADSIGSGINYFDVAPFYGGGEAELKLGEALEPFREAVFLACKTLQRETDGARQELEQSLNRLKTDHFDLYQFHAVTSMEEVDRIFAPGGALTAFLRARDEGKIRYIGFSAHSASAALAMLDRFAFDSILFPVNYVCWIQGNFGPQVLGRAKELGVARLALKSMAQRPWRKGEQRPYPNCWYRPVDDPVLALQALRFTLSEDVSALIPPGDPRLFRMAVNLAPRLTPLTISERETLMESAHGLKPLMRG
jgi:aryl-alcohol dehydrogenase-like predicted oxidoreductase